MIKSFNNKALEKLFKENSNQGIPSKLAKRIKIQQKIDVWNAWQIYKQEYDKVLTVA